MKKPILSSLFPIALLAASLSVKPIASAETFTFNLGGTTIPDGNPVVGVVNSQAPATGIDVITGLTVNLNIAGDAAFPGWNGDLYAYLRHITPGGTGFTVLLNRTGVTSSNSFGYGDTGFNVTFDDAAANGDIHLYQNVITPAALSLLTGTWKPDGRNVDPNAVVDTDTRTALLSSFNTLSAKGTWTLFVQDLSSGATSTINSWGMTITGLGGSFYWKGKTSGVWNSFGNAANPNWTADAGGATPILATPDALSDVIFSATGATNQNTTLGANFTIHSLTISDTAAVTINSGAGGPFTLTISGAATTGIDVQSTAGLVNIGANVTLAGSSDTITVNNTAGAVIGGTLSGGNGLIKAGTGKLTLSGANNYTAGTTINNGILAISGDGNLGNTAAGVTFNNNATLQTLAGVTFAGTRNLTVNGTGGTIDAFGQASTINGQISGTGSLSVTDSAALGKLTLTGNNSGLTGGLAVSGQVTVAVGVDNNLGSPAAPLSLSNNAVLETTATFPTARPVHLPNSIGNFNVDPGVTTTLNGSVDGVGNLQKFGSGNLVLTNNNTGYSGTTILSGGSLFADVSPAGPTNQALGTGLINVLNAGVTLGTHVDGEVIPNAILAQADFSVAPPTGGSLFMNGDVTLTGNRIITSQNNGSNTHFGGAIGGAFALTLADAVVPAGFNRIFFEGTTPNTYSGLTTIQNNADLHLAKSDGVTAIAGNLQIDSGGTVAWDRNEQIANTSTVTVSGTGLAGSPDHAAILLKGHTETIGSLFGSGTLALDDNAGGAAGSFTVGAGSFSGVISDSNMGNGQFIKNTAGTLTLTGANTYKSGTTLTAGTLQAGNVKALGSGNFTMTGGTLMSTGGPLAVDIGAGNILFSGGTYVANVGGTSPGVLHDQLRTTGSASITGGKLALVRQNGYTLAPGDKVTLLAATAGVAGGTANGTAVPGSNVTGLAAFSNTALLVPTVNLYPTSVVLEAMQGSFASLISTLALTPNQSAVAAALDSLTKLTGGHTGIFKELTFLDTQSLATLKANLDKISPEEVTAIFSLSNALANVQSANIQQRLADIRLELGKVISIHSVNVSDGGTPGPVGRHSKEIAPADDERWGLWMSGSGEFTHVGSTTNAAGFNMDTGGITAGVDYRFGDKFVAGISIGYMNTHGTLANGGSVDVDGGRVGACATYFDRGMHVDASVSGGPNSYRTRRVTPNNTQATGTPEGTEVNLLLAGGYDWKKGALTFGPVASFQYTNVQLNGFTETGGFAPLSIVRKNADSARSSLGFHASYDLKAGRAIVRPEAGVSWQHEFGDTSYSLTSSFATLGGSPFTVSGPATGRDSMLVRAGVSVQWNDRFSTYAFYDGELLRTNYRSNNISLGFRWRF